MSLSNAKSICPASPQEWRKWLQENHKQEQSVWLIYNKKGSGVPSLSWSEAVDEALCFGWVDGRRQPIDDKQFRQLFTPRKPNSLWSKINKDKVARLIREGKMTAEGQKCIGTAKTNGMWTYMDAVEAGIVPRDLQDALNQDQDALDFFQSQRKSVKKMMLTWVHMAKKEETRKKRIHEIVTSAAKGEKPSQL